MLQLNQTITSAEFRKNGSTLVGINAPAAAVNLNAVDSANGTDYYEVWVTNGATARTLSLGSTFSGMGD